MKIIKIDGLKILVSLYLFFAFSYCSIWGYWIFQNRALEMVYGGFIFLSAVFTLLNNPIQKKAISILMILIYFVLIVSKASFTYLLFFGGILVMVAVGIKSKYIEFFARTVNFFCCLQIIGMLVCKFLPQVYIHLFLPAFSGVDYYSKLYDSIMMGGTNIGFTCQNAHFAGFMVLGIANRICLYKDNKRYLKFRTTVYLILSVFGLYLSGKRAHFGFCFLALLITYYYMVYLKGKNNSRLNRAVGLITISSAGFFCLWIVSFLVEGTLINEIFDTIGSLGDSNVDVTTGRVDFWLVAIQLFKSNPILGIGWKKFFELKFYGQSYDVHNIYLQLLCETGIIGTMIFVLFFIVFIRKTLKIIRNRNTEASSKRIAILSLFYQIFFLLYGITGNPLYDSSYYKFYFILAAFINGISSATDNDISMRRKK